MSKHFIHRYKGNHIRRRKFFMLLVHHKKAIIINSTSSGIVIETLYDDYRISRKGRPVLDNPRKHRMLYPNQRLLDALELLLDVSKPATQQLTISTLSDLNSLRVTLLGEKSRMNQINKDT